MLSARWHGDHLARLALLRRLVPGSGRCPADAMAGASSDGAGMEDSGEEAWITALECIYGFALAHGHWDSYRCGHDLFAYRQSDVLSVAGGEPVHSESRNGADPAGLVRHWDQSKLAMAFVIAFFPVVVDTATGLRSTSPELLELARSLQCSRLQTFFKIQLPSALPSIFSGRQDRGDACRSLARLLANSSVQTKGWATCC